MAPQFLDQFNLNVSLGTSMPIAAIAGLALYGGYLQFKKPRPRLPPGPKGTLFSLPKNPDPLPWIGYAKWAETYGDVMYFSALGNQMLILNSYEAMIDLCEKNSELYSSRPVRTMNTELLGFNFMFSSMPANDEWKRHRNLFMRYFGTKERNHYHDLQTKYTAELLRKLLHDPAEFRLHIRSTAASVVLSLAYGYEVAGTHDKYVALLDRVTRIMNNAGVFGTYIVDYIPWLKYLPKWTPFATFHHYSSKHLPEVRELCEKPYDVVKQALKEGNASSCLVADELENIYNGTRNISEDTLRNVASTTFIGGGDTVVSALASFFLVMANFPDIQKRCQAEVDRVLQGRLPTYADRPDLPFVDSVCSELLRWNPVTPLALVRTVGATHEYKGYTIPKGTTVMTNVWAALHDERYPDPFEFKPDRFLDKEKNAREGINPPPDIIFGFSRRMCPGRYFATDFLFLSVASLLVSFNIAKARDKDGNELDAPIEYTPHILSHPKDFPCSITPRSESIAAIIEATANA